MKQSIASIALIVISIAMHAQEIDLLTKAKKFARDTGDGVVLGTVTATGYQPFAAVKNALQQQRAVNLNPKILYRGYSNTLQGIIATTALQPPMNALIKQLISGDENSTYTNITAAFLAGCSSAIVASPFELMVAQRQKTQLAAGDVIKSVIMPQGIKTAWRGLPATAAREGIFTVGYLTLADTIGSSITQSDNKLINSVIGGIPAGVIAALSTHPFDTIKTCMQSNLNEKEYKTFVNTAITIMQKEGPKGFYAGITPRVTAFVLLIPLMSYVAEQLKSLHE